MRLFISRVIVMSFDQLQCYDTCTGTARYGCSTPSLYIELVTSTHIPRFIHTFTRYTVGHYTLVVLANTVPLLSHSLNMYTTAFISVFLWATVIASPITRRDAAPSFVFDGDAPFTVDVATLAASLTCPNGNPSSKSPAVLLVHGMCIDLRELPSIQADIKSGTSTTGAESWGQGYVPALAANGYTACYLTLRWWFPILTEW